MINLAKRNTDGMAYLVLQSQEVVIEKDGSDCHTIILVEMSCSQPQKQWKSVHTFPVVLGISKSRGRESSLVNRRELTNNCQGRQCPSIHWKTWNANGTFLVKWPSAVSSLKRESCRTGEYVTSRHSGGTILQDAGVEYAVLLRRHDLSPVRVFCMSD